MKPTTILKTVLISAALSLPMMFTSCKEDAPELMHKTAELEHKWMWHTIEGDDFDFCEVTIRSISEDEIEVINFHQQGTMVMKVDGTNLSFEGSLNDGAMVVTNGKGIITNSWTQLNIEYYVEVGDGPQHFKAELTEDKIMAKKAVVSSAK